MITSLSLFLKRTLDLTGIGSVVRAIVSYGLDRHLARNPHVFEYLQRQHVASQIESFRRHLHTVGDGLTITGRIYVSEPRGVVIGSNVLIDDNACFLTRGGLIIGDNTHFARNVTICTSEHEYEGRALPYDSRYRDKPVVIGRNVSIEMNVTISPGVTIGEGAVIGMGTTVSSDVPAFAIVAPQGHAVTHIRDIAHYRRQEAAHRWSGEAGKLLPPAQRSPNFEDALSKGAGMFFVLGTGRSGSTTIAKSLSRQPEVTCMHEPKLQLQRTSALYAYGELTDEQVMAELRDLYVGNATLPPGIYGESDQKFSNLVPLLAELLPDARFVWLIRNPVDAVNSMYSRGWYADIEQFPPADAEPRDDPLYRFYYSEHRLRGDRAGAMSTEQWRAMSPFARNCWYWAYWNSLIEQQLSRLPAERSFSVRLEDLEDRLPSLLEFLGAECGPDAQVTRENVAQTKHQLTTKDGWTQDQKREFSDLCDALYRKWYPGAVDSNEFD